MTTAGPTTVASPRKRVLRALVEAEIAARDASNERARLKAATFPVIKTIENFDLAASSIRASCAPESDKAAWLAEIEQWRSADPDGLDLQGDAEGRLDA